MSAVSVRPDLLRALPERVVVADGDMATSPPDHDLALEDFQDHEGGSEILTSTRSDVVRSVRDADPLAAVLWDMDGLLVDSEPLWTIAEIELAERLGGVWGEQIKVAVVGTRLDVAVPTILAWYGVEPTVAQVAQTSTWLLRRMAELFADALPVMPGAQDLLADLAAAGVPQALVSSSYRVLVDAALATGLGPFSLTIAGDEVGHGKPHPEPYLTAAARLGVEPVRCVVLEDSPSGVASGEAAGCAVVAVPSVVGVLLQPGPRRLVARSLADVTMADLRMLAGTPL